MLIEEFQVFNSIISNLISLESFHGRNISELAVITSEIQKTSESTQTFFGFLKKITKEEKIEDLRTKQQKLNVDVGIGNELLCLIHRVIFEREIPLLKSQKKGRFDKIIYEFSQSRIQELEKELLLWQTINLPDEENDEEKQDNKKIEQRDFRFTELPLLKEQN